MDPASLKKLYQWFDQLIELPPDEEQRELQSLRQKQEPLVLHLECLLASARKHTNTTAAFDIDDLVDAAELMDHSESLADSINQLSGELTLDPTHNCYRVGNFLLIRCLSVSKLGITYYARDALLDRDVVALLAMPKWRANPALKSQLIDSARVVAKLFHPNVAAILGTTEIEGQFIILREWIPGSSLHESLQQSGPLPLSIALDLADGIASGLQALHDNNVLHGDLKPANIILRDQPVQPVITDFGTSLWLGTPNEMNWKGGTPGYIAPEILQGARTSKAADLYSLGVILYQLLCPEKFSANSIPPEPLRWNPSSAYPNSFNQTPNSSSPLNLPPQNSPQTQSRLRYQQLVDALLQDQIADRPESIQVVLQELKAIRADLAAYSPTGFTNPVDPCSRNSQPLQPNSIPADSIPINSAQQNPNPSTSIPPSRRQWIRQALEYGILGATATSIGFFATRVLEDRNTLKSPYVPGIPADQHLFFQWDRNPIYSPLLADTRFPPSELWDTDFIGVSPTVAHRWIHLESNHILLPDFQAKANLIMFGARFDLPPKRAAIQLAYRYRGFSNWNTILNVKNTFGGLYYRAFQLSIANENIQPSKSLQFRISVWTDVVAKTNGNSAPVSLNIHQDRTNQAMVQLRIWNRLINRPDEKVNGNA